MTFGSLVTYGKLFGDLGMYLGSRLSFIDWLSEINAILLCNIPIQFLIIPESINALRWCNFLGLASIAYLSVFVTFVGIRYFSGWASFEILHAQGSIEDNLFTFRAAWLAPFSTLSSTFMCHYN